MEPTPSWASIRTITLLPPLYREVLEQMGGAGSPAEDASTRTYSIKINNNNNTNNNNEKEEEEDLLEDAERKRERERESQLKKASAGLESERKGHNYWDSHTQHHPPTQSLLFLPPSPSSPSHFVPKKVCLPSPFQFPPFSQPSKLNVTSPLVS